MSIDPRFWLAYKQGMMDASLLALKVKSYQAASKYHKAFGEWLAEGRTPERQHLVLTAATEYALTLHALIQYFRSLELSVEICKEWARTERFKELLSLELELM